MSDVNFEDGQEASVAIQRTILELLGKGLCPRSISLATLTVGASMLVDHYGKQNGGEIGNGLLQKALGGELALNPALRAANQNIVDH